MMGPVAEHSHHHDPAPSVDETEVFDAAFWDARYGSAPTRSGVGTRTRSSSRKLTSRPWGAALGRGLRRRRGCDLAGRSGLARHRPSTSRRRCSGARRQAGPPRPVRRSRTASPGSRPMSCPGIRPRCPVRPGVGAVHAPAYACEESLHRRLAAAVRSGRERCSSWGTIRRTWRRRRTSAPITPELLFTPGRRSSRSSSPTTGRSSRRRLARDRSSTLMAETSTSRTRCWSPAG